MIHLYRIIIPVNDIDIAEKFYSHVLGDPGERVSAGRHYFNCSGIILACYDPTRDGDNLANGWHYHFNQYIYFSVSDLDNLLKISRDAGAEIISEIEEKPWGERLFYARDPFGNPISFVDENTLFFGSKINKLNK